MEAQIHDFPVPKAYLVAKTRKYRGMARYTRAYGPFQVLYGTGIVAGVGDFEANGEEAD